MNLIIKYLGILIDFSSKNSHSCRTENSLLYGKGFDVCDSSPRSNWRFEYEMESNLRRQSRSVSDFCTGSWIQFCFILCQLQFDSLSYQIMMPSRPLYSHLSTLIKNQRSNKLALIKEMISDTTSVIRLETSQHISSIGKGLTSNLMIALKIESHLSYSQYTVGLLDFTYVIFLATNPFVVWNCTNWTRY